MTTDLSQVTKAQLKSKLSSPYVDEWINRLSQFKTQQALQKYCSKPPVVTLRILKEVSKRLGLTGYSKLNKPNLTTIIFNKVKAPLTPRFAKMRSPNGVFIYEDIKKSFANDYEKYFQYLKKPLLSKIKLNMKESMKIQMGLEFLFVIVKPSMLESSEMNETIHEVFQQYTFTIDDFSAAESKIDEAIAYFNKFIHDYNERGTGGIFKEVKANIIEMKGFSRMRSGRFTELPESIIEKKGVLNIQNSDEKCILWCILAHLFPTTTNQNRITNYKPHLDKLKTGNLKFPLTVNRKTLETLEQLNDHFNFALNIFQIETKETIKDGETIITDTVVPMYLSKRLVPFDNYIYILYFNNHFSYIKSPSRVLKFDGDTDHKRHICPRCLFNHKDQEKVKEHFKYCLAHNGSSSIVKMPKQGSSLEFKNFKNKHRLPYIIPFDCETTLKTMDKIKQEFDKQTSKLEKIQVLKNYTHVSKAKLGKLKLIPESELWDYFTEKTKSNTEFVQSHVANSFAMNLVTEDPEFANTQNYKQFNGDDCVEQFINCLTSTSEMLFDKMRAESKFKPTFHHKVLAAKATHCHICKKRFEKEKDKVIDHSYETNQFRGIAHNICNLHYTHKKHPIVISPAHNLKGYDGSIVLNKIAKVAKEQDWVLSAIPQNFEKFISFTMTKFKTFKNGNKTVRKVMGSIRFIDSLAFLSAPLEELTKNLKDKDINEFKETFKNFKNIERQDVIDYALQKGIYPYSYMNDTKKFTETSLPDIKYFYNDMKQKACSQEDYDFAQAVWKKFNMQTLQDYHDFYLKTDVLLLSDILTAFRELTIKTYELDPMNYYTIPGLALDAALLATGEKLELISDPNMYAFFEKGIRGGSSFVRQKFAKANNQQCELYDPDKPKTYIIYVDANNQYGWAMCEALPYKNFKWVSKENLKYKKMEAGKGRTYEVTLKYPEHLQDDHAHLQFPIAINLEEINNTCQYSLELRKQQNEKEQVSKKLAPTFYERKRYIVHHKALEFYLEKGLEIKKIHRIVEYDEKAWLKPYIEKNSKLRQDSENEFEKAFYKLMNNSVYGKTMENVRKRTKVDFATSKTRFNKLFKKHTMKRWKEIGDLSLFEMQNPTVTLNKPIFCGQAILDIAKILMYRFHYDYIMTKYGKRAILLYTDTDSFIYLIETENIYEDMFKDKDIRDVSKTTGLYDLSNFYNDSPFYNDSYSKVQGAFKSERAELAIEEFIGLRAKMYSCKAANPKTQISKQIDRIEKKMLTATPDEIKKLEKKKKGFEDEIENGLHISKACGTKSYHIKNKFIQHEDYRKSLFENFTRHDINMNFKVKDLTINTVKINKKSLSPCDNKFYTFKDDEGTIQQRPWGHYKNIEIPLIDEKNKK